jgi:hypothetical protein
VGDKGVAEGREIMSLSLPLSESSSVPSPMWRKLGELLLSLDGEGVDTEGCRRDAKPRGRFGKNAELEGCRGKRDGERGEVVEGVLSTDRGLVVTCVALETRWGEGECDDEIDATEYGESPEAGYDEWDVDMESDLEVSSDGWGTLGDTAWVEPGTAGETE